MPSFTVFYKLPADPGHKYWPVARTPDEGMALALFNASADAKPLGQFKFDPNGFTPTDYYLVEDGIHYHHLSRV
jgi:hypothetical protein